MDNQLIVISSQISPENYNKNNRERNKLQKLEHVLGGEGTVVSSHSDTNTAGPKTLSGKNYSQESTFCSKEFRMTGIGNAAPVLLPRLLLFPSFRNRKAVSLISFVTDGRSRLKHHGYSTLV